MGTARANLDVALTWWDETLRAERLFRRARCELFGRGLSGTAREQPATVAVGAVRTAGWSVPRSTRSVHVVFRRQSPHQTLKYELSKISEATLGWVLPSTRSRCVGTHLKSSVLNGRGDAT